MSIGGAWGGTALLPAAVPARHSLHHGRLENLILCVLPDATCREGTPESRGSSQGNHAHTDCSGRKQDRTTAKATAAATNLLIFDHNCSRRRLPIGREGQGKRVSKEARKQGCSLAPPPPLPAQGSRARGGRLILRRYTSHSSQRQMRCPESAHSRCKGDSAAVRTHAGSPGRPRPSSLTPHGAPANGKPCRACDKVPAASLSSDLDRSAVHKQNKVWRREDRDTAKRRQPWLRTAKKTGWRRACGPACCSMLE